jgi:hypothetical protein
MLKSSFPAKNRIFPTKKWRDFDLLSTRPIDEFICITMVQTGKLVRIEKERYYKLKNTRFGGRVKRTVSSTIFKDI